MIRANWGPLNKVIEFEPSTKVSTVYGSGNTEDLITEMFTGGLTSGFFVRVGSGGTAPTLTLKLESGGDAGAITGSYVGDRAFTASIRDSIITDQRECIIYEGTAEFLKVSFDPGENEPAALKAAMSKATKDFFFLPAENATGVLAEVVQAEFTPGTNPTVTNADYSNAFGALEPCVYNVICIDTDSISVQMLLDAYLDRIYEAGNYPMCTIAADSSKELEDRMTIAKSFNDPKITYVLNSAVDAAGRKYEGYPEWTDKIFGLLEQFAPYAPRRFDVTIQLSLDGPEEITDATRGAGTTKKCLANFDRLLARAGEIPENVSLFLAFKPTLSVDTMYRLDSKERIVEYYRFFEELIGRVTELGLGNLNINFPVPNIAVPAPAGKADGEYFARLVRNCREIEEENPFRFYREITPFSTNVRPKDEDTYNYPCFNCGTGSKNIGFLPNRLISSCHNGFVDVLKDYEENFLTNPDSSIDAKLFQPTHNKFTHTEADYPDYERQISRYNAPGSLCRMGCLAGFIRTLAIAGEIEEKYATEKGAFRGAELYQSCTCNCLRDNYMVTGSTSLQPEGMIKLLLNGAVDYILPDCRKGGEETQNAGS